MPTWLTQRRNAFIVAAGVAVAMLSTPLVMTHAWAGDFREEQRLLPNTTVDGVDVSNLTVAEATERLSEHEQDLLDSPIVLEHDRRTWTVTPAELGATTDLDDVIEVAVGLTDNASLPTMVSARWLDRGGNPFEMTVSADPKATATFLQSVAEDIDADPDDAHLRWDNGTVKMVSDLNGYQLDTNEAAPRLHQAVHLRTDEVVLPVDVLEADRTSEQVEVAYRNIEPYVTDLLDRTVTFSHDDITWDLTAREFGASPQVDALLDAALNNEPLPAAFDLDNELVDMFVSDVHDATFVEAHNATVSADSGRVDITPDVDGLQVDREKLADQVRSTLIDVDAQQQLAVPVSNVTADVTTDRFSQVLLLRQDERRVYLYQDGEVTHDWPVAIGAASSRTPTGTFTVGAKRYQPTWHNPARDRWGSDMPAVMGPGPDNPLGARALNWHTPAGHDNLIRFHGTPATHTIGQAVSNGCVRMYNSHVIEMYDLVETDTTILSTWG